MKDLTTLNAQNDQATVRAWREALNAGNLDLAEKIKAAHPDLAWAFHSVGE